MIENYNCKSCNNDIEYGSDIFCFCNLYGNIFCCEGCYDSYYKRIKWYKKRDYKKEASNIVLPERIIKKKNIKYNRFEIMDI